MKCYNCDKDTTNPKFCGMSCSASFNNRKPKRKLEGACKTCEVPIHAGWRYCDEHRQVVNKEINSNTGANSGVRAQARILYRKSGRPLSCALCGYAVHVDICHIKDIRSYAHGTPYTVVNASTNLVALCRNHHWEFDHDLL